LVLGEKGFIIANAGAAAESICKLNRDEGRAAAVTTTGGASLKQNRAMACPV
jgi:hypothetical protein